MANFSDEHGHDHAPAGDGHEHGADDHDHGHEHGHRGGGLFGPLTGLFRPHRHDHAESVDDALLADQAGRRTLVVSLVGLLLTGAVQAVIVSFSGSVGLLADTIHNLADALTALPIGLAFWASRRPATRRYTYGYGRSEDLAGLSVVLVMTVSAAIAAWQAIGRLIHPHPVHNLAWVAAAGVIGFAGNELAAVYRIRTGTRIGSAALAADGRHARADGLTSLAVVAGAASTAAGWLQADAVTTAAGWLQADAVTGLVITVAILSVLYGAVRDIYRRLMDAVDPALVGQLEREAVAIPGVLGCDGVRIRWIGHELHAELNITVDAGLTVREAHDITEDARHRLLHRVSRLADTVIHVNPPDSEQAHARTAHHLPQPNQDRRRPGTVHAAS
jgi:cation diffusion facilitator family transporter